MRVPTKMMAAARRTGRNYGKSDPIDALAAARAALQEPDLPAGTVDSPGTPVTPPSLYLAQLAERLGPRAVKDTGY